MIYEKEHVQHPPVFIPDIRRPGENYLLSPTDPMTRKLFLKKTDSLKITKNPVGFGVHFIRYCLCHETWIDTVFNVISPLSQTLHWKSYGGRIQHYPEGLDYPVSILPFINKCSLPVSDHSRSIYEKPERTR